MSSSTDRNWVLIGMPGVGKSTIGVLLAKAAGRSFVDTDVSLQAAQRRALQEIIDRDGLEEFRRIEAEHVARLNARHAVIATGGSVIYYESAMRRLHDGGLIIHLDLPLEKILRRVDDIPTRGLVMAPGETIASLHAERDPLYRRWADVTVDCSGLNHEQTVAAVLSAVNARK